MVGSWQECGANRDDIVLVRAEKLAFGHEQREQALKAAKADIGRAVVPAVARAA
jgi:hypothetical protein